MLKYQLNRISLSKNISNWSNQHTLRSSIILTLVLHIYYLTRDPCRPPPPSFLFPSYPLLRLPLPGTGPVEFTTGVRDYSVPSHEPQGDLGERPDWVGAQTCFFFFLLSLFINVTLKPNPHPNKRLIL